MLESLAFTCRAPLPMLIKGRDSKTLEISLLDRLSKIFYNPPLLKSVRLKTERGWEDKKEKQ